MGIYVALNSTVRRIFTSQSSYVLQMRLKCTNQINCGLNMVI